MNETLAICGAVGAYAVRFALAMPRPSSVHVCSQCGHETARWAGRCPGCGEWNTLVEERAPARRRRARGRSGAARPRRATPVKPIALRDVRPTSTRG